MDKKQHAINLLETYIKPKNAKVIEQIINKISFSEKDYISNLYESLCLLKCHKVQTVAKILARNQIGLKNQIFDDLAKRESEFEKYMESPIDITEGVLTCTCGSNKVFSFMKQTRGLDEKMTIFAQCSSCKRKWVE